MNRKDSKRKSHLELTSQTINGNGVVVTVKARHSQSRRRRRMTCPSAAEINRALGSVTLEQLGKSCSLEELMEKCIQSFDVDGKLWRNEDTIHMILVMHSWVVPSADFARKLLQLYREASQNHRRMQICHFLRFWVNQYPEVFRKDSELEELMGDFWEVVKEKRRPSDPRQSIECSCFSDQEIKKPFPQSPSFNKKRKVSLLFDHLEPSELADHLTYLEFKCFCRISHLDYQSYTLQNSLREIPRLERSVNLCNSISQWVQLMILNRPTPQQRAEVFTKFIQVTQKLRKLQNFNTLMAVIGGLCHSAISRLKETHSYLSHDVLKTLSGMTELLSSSSNYSTYRRVYNECGGFKIPILGVQLKDLVSLNEALPDYLDNGKINVSKLQSLYQHILELRQLQKASPPIKTNKDVILLLTTSLDTFYKEDEIFTLSYTREPRSSKLMSVFQFYDPDERGLISREDFEKVISSFPFPCQILEKDREGPVAREEMTAYFMKASQVCSRLGLPFLQSLVEIRLKETPLCANCIWSVAKQGYVTTGLHKYVMENWPTSQGSVERKSEKHGPHVSGAADSSRMIAHCVGGCKKSETLLKKLKETEEERNRLLLQNTGLHCTNSQLAAENANLHSQLCALQDKVQALSKDFKMKPAALTQILETLKALKIQSDTTP
ncbi:RAS guanyl-releasing protein 4 isoform X2 [Ranitomeya variabilis]|uniref:RAS guanyl-releasing protein 4 isoform X2 n=1 Tax=Ranitomeya variabilis TaxID=490064 RepID=UPI004056D99F